MKMCFHRIFWDSIYNKKNWIKQKKMSISLFFSIKICLMFCQVHTTYLWDPVRKVVDLSKAVISIPKTAINNPNCLDYVQVTTIQSRKIIVVLKYIKGQQDGKIWVPTQIFSFHTLSFNILLTNLDRIFQQQFCASFPNKT